jgi:DNA repair exonuclease SbcCD nuclease subunit
MVKFIHTADWQIGMKAAHVGAVGQKVRSERLESARRVIDVATNQQADFIIVAGDTFEDNAVERVLVQKVTDILGSFSGPVYLISGNHDPLVPGSVWGHPAWQSHPNLHLLTEAHPVELDGVMLYPCPLFEKHSLDDPTRWINAHDDQNIAIGIAHGTVNGVSLAEPDFPIARDAAAGAGLNYLALGHWHSYASYPSADGDIRMAYSGTHEQTKFGERDSGNVLLVEIQNRGSAPKLTSIPTGGLNWTTCEETLTAVGDVSRVRQRIETWPAAAKTLLDLRIEGILHHEDQSELERIDELITARFLYGRVDTARLTPSPADESWLEAVPLGVMRSVAQELQLFSDPAYSHDRPEFATPEVATRALLELYRLVQEDNA